MTQTSKQKLKLSTIPSHRLDSWLRDAEGLRTRIQSKSWEAAIAKIIELVHKQQVTLCFAGHQNAGKSTLVNGTTRRNMMSVDDQPETGVISRIVAGSRDVAVARKGERTWSIECTPAAIRAVTALQPGVKRRNDDELVDELSIQLQDTPIPPQVCWLDAPGSDDTEEMTKRSKKAAGQSDVLIFVAATRQPLSVGEMAYIAEHVERHGPASVMLAVNAIMDRDDAECWKDFQQRKVPFFTQRIAETYEDMGFTDELPLSWFPLSARALATGDGALLGGKEFMQMLLGIDSPDHPRVQRTRLFRAARQLDHLVTQIDEQRVKAQQQMEERERLWKAEFAAAKQASERFRRDIDQEVGNCLADFSQRIRNLGTALEASVEATQSGVSLSAICAHDRDWNQRAKNAADAVFEILTTKIASLARRHDQQCLSADGNLKLRNRLSAPSISILGYRDDLDQIGNSAALVAGGATAGVSVWFLGPFAIAAAAAAAAVARNAAIENAAKEARDKIRSDIDRKTDAAATGIHSQRSSLVNLVMEICSPPLSGPRQDTEGRATVQSLTELATQATQVAEQAHSMATSREVQ